MSARFLWGDSWWRRSKVRLSLHQYEPSSPSIRPALISGFLSMKRLGVFLLHPGWDASPSQITPSIKFADTHLHSWVERATVRVKCLVQEHRPTMSPARARTRTAQSYPESSALNVRLTRLQHIWPKWYRKTDEWPKKFTDKMVFLCVKCNNLNKILLLTFDVSCALKLEFDSSDVFVEIANSLK